MTSQDALLDKAYRLAYDYEARVGSCPQCVFAAVMETLGVGTEDVFKSCQGLAGGTALSTKGTCGALIGGLLAIGCMVGRDYTEFKQGEKKRQIFRYSKRLYDRFMEEYGSLLCCDIQQKLFGRSFNLLDKEEYELFLKMGGHEDKCPSVSGNVARWTTEIILEELKK